MSRTNGGSLSKISRFSAILGALSSRLPKLPISTVCCVDTFVPHDLRRTTTTGTRAILGKEAAKVLLGHTKTDVTDIYLLEEVQEAMKVPKAFSS